MNNLGENRPTEEVEEEEERREDRRWLWLVLFLLLLVFCCLLSSSQLAIFHGLNDTIEAQLIPTDQNRLNADDPLDGLTELPLDPAKVSRQLTAEKSDGVSSEVIVAVTRQIPGTAVAQRPTPTATNTPRPTFTAPAAPDESTPSPAEKTATAQATQPLSGTPGPTITNTPRPTFTHTPTPSPTVPGTPTFTPTPIPPTPTLTPSIVPTPTFTPLPPPTNTPVPPPTNTPGSPATNTPKPPSTSTSTPVPPPPTETPIPTDTPTLTPTPTDVPNAGVIIVPDQGVNVNPGQIVTYIHTVTNTGSTADTFTISAVSSQGYATTILPPNPITLSPGNSADVTLTVAIPNNAVAGTIDLTTVTVASASASDSAVDTTIVNQIIGVVIQPDSRVSVLPGAQAVHTHVVTNTGNANDTITFTPSGTNPDYLVADISPITLGPFAGQTINVTISTPLTSSSVLSDETLITASSGNGPVTDSVTDTTIIADPDITLNAAAGDQLVSLGWAQAAPPAPSISYELEYSIAGGPWGTLTSTLPFTRDRYYHDSAVNNTEYAYQLKVYNSGTLIGYSNVATATPGDISAHRTTLGCNTTTAISVTVPTSSTTFTIPDCIAGLADIDAVNPTTDAGMVIIFADGEVTLNYGTAPIAGIIDGPDYDFAYYGLPVTTTITGTIMSYTLIDVSVDGTTWTTVFSWDGIIGGVENSNVAAFGADGEDEAEAIPATALLEDRMSMATPPNWNTGVAIDIRPYLKAGVNYRYVRIRSPSGAAGARHLDAVYRIN